ncbi:MAG: hypothetical protein E7404_06375 [Ruminococcaceae bacterium]|nr:hypothetical protein [Oscillospiraceae bacterium]
MKKFNTDKFLIFLCLWVFVVVLISQIGLKIPYLKSVFTDIEVFEGKAINEDSAINSGVITLEMVSGLPSDEFEIMINGEKYDVFDEKVKKIEILSTSVVEVLSSSKDGAVIKISDMTSNLKAVTSGIDVSIKKGINMVSRIILKS